MVEYDYGSSTSTFLGLRIKVRAGGCASKASSNISKTATTGCGEEEAMSVMSVAGERPQDFFDSVIGESNLINKNHFFKNPNYSSALSVISDISSCSTKMDDNVGIGSSNSECSHEFLIQCRNGEMLFVPATQGKLIKSRCRHFRNLFSIGDDIDGRVDDNKIGRAGNDNSIVKKPGWMIGTARHVIELLTTGTTWIENDFKKFSTLSSACEQIGVRLCLGSLINYHDILDRASTMKFFDLIHRDKYQFKIRGTIKSWQWMHLVHRGILLLSRSKILMITVAPPCDGTAQLPTSARSTKIVTKVSSVQPNRDRLTKCDELSSEFRVYSSGSKINAILTIMDVLSKGADGTNNTIKAVSSGKVTANDIGRSPPEEFKVVYLTKIGSLQQEDMNMLWRLTSASYTLATPEERQYLKRTIPPAGSKMKQPFITRTTETTPHRTATSTSHDDMSNGLTEETIRTDSTTNTNDTTSAQHPHRLSCHHSEGGEGIHDSTHSDRSISTKASSSSSSCSSSREVPKAFPSSSNDNNDTSLTPERYQVRTLTAISFLILKHLFEPINACPVDGTDGASTITDPYPAGDCRSGHNSTKTLPSTQRRDDPTMLPACLLIRNPTPDTLGRFLNAAAVGVAASSTDNVCDDSVDNVATGPSHGTNITIDVGWDVTSSTTIMFSISNTSCHLKRLLDHLADYSNTAIVEGPGQFIFHQHAADCAL